MAESTTSNGSNRKLKLHQVLAIESNIRTQTQKDITAAHHGLQHAGGLIGLNKTYEPKDDEGDQLPEEKKILEVRTPDIIRKTTDILAQLYDTTAMRDFANCQATADIILEDGTVLLKDAPATYLLWLERRLDDVHTFVAKLPILPADTEWEYDEKQDAFKSPAIKTSRSLKIPYPLVLHPGSDKHPAQVVEKNREEVVGHWTTIKYSGAMKAKDVAQMKERVEQLQRATKIAREKANTVDAPKQDVGRKLLSFVFGEHLEV